MVLNEEPIRAAFYVMWDAGSFSSLRDYLHQIDLLFPEWLHVLTPDGHLQGVDEANKAFDVIDPSGSVRAVDQKVMPLVKGEKANIEVFPLVNNFDPVAQKFLPSVSDFLNNAEGRANFRRQILTFLATDRYRGISLDLEEIPLSAQPGFNALVRELGSDMHSHGMKLFVNVGIDAYFLHVFQVAGRGTKAQPIEHVERQRGIFGTEGRRGGCERQKTEQYRPNPLQAS